MSAKQQIMRAAACQIITSDDVARSTKAVVDWIGRAAEQKIRLVAFPEGCLHGYTPDMAFWRKARPATFRRAEERIAQACRRYRVAAVVGSAHREDGNWMNSLAIIDQPRPAGRPVQQGHSWLARNGVAAAGICPSTTCWAFRAASSSATTFATRSWFACPLCVERSCASSAAASRP